MSWRPDPPAGISLGQPERPRARILLVVAVVLLVAVIAVGADAATGHLQLPFVGKPTVTYVDPVYHWSIVFPKAWAAKKLPNQDVIRYQSDGDGVGIRIQAQFLTGIINAAASRSSAMTKELNLREGPTTGRPDSTILSGPTFGSINGAPYVHYVLTYSDFSSGVQVLLEDSDYYVFNGANLETVTFETDAKNYSSHSRQFLSAIESFRSKYLTVGNLPPSPGVSSTATPASPTPAASTVTPTASP